MELLPARRRTGFVSDAVLDELATDSVMWPSQSASGTIEYPVLPIERNTGDLVIGDPLTDHRDRSPLPTASAAKLALMGLALGIWARGTGLVDSRKRRRGQPLSVRKPI